MGAAPPLTGVAVNVTLVPVHIFVAEALTDTDGVTELFTFNEIVLLVAVGVAAQPALVVMITFTCAPFVSAVELNVLVLVPAFAPLTCHWYEGLDPPKDEVAVNVTFSTGTNSRCR